MPKMSGIELCKRYRAAGNHTPIIMLTARGQEFDKVVGLRIFGDGYAAKSLASAPDGVLCGHVPQEAVTGILMWARASVFFPLFR